MNKPQGFFSTKQFEDPTSIEAAKEVNSRIRAYLIANERTLFNDLGLDEKFKWFKVSYYQDRVGTPKFDEITGKLIEGEYEPPSYKWVFLICGKRIKDDDFFQVQVIEYNEELLNNDIQKVMKLLDEDFTNAYLSLLDFGDCECCENLVCDKHLGFISV